MKETTLQREANRDVLTEFRNNDEKHTWVVKQGLKGAAVWGAFGAGTSVFLQSRSSVYRRISLPYKVFLGLMVPTAAFFTITDRAAMHADRAIAQQHSVTRNDAPEADNRVFTLGRWTNDNKYLVLAATWALSMGSALAYNFTRKHIPLSQKLINSRMIAQTLALVGMSALAVLTSTQSIELAVTDPHLDHVINPKQ